MLSQKIKLRIQFDQVPDYFCGSMGTWKCIQEADGSAQFNPADTKRCATVLPTLWVASGEYGTLTMGHFPTVVILIGEPKTSAVLDEKHDDRVVVTWTKCGVVSAKWMTSFFAPRIRGWIHDLGVEPKNCLVVFDSCRSHLGMFRTSLEAASFTCAVVPPGTTSFLQLIDVFFAAGFKRAQRPSFRLSCCRKGTG